MAAVSANKLELLQIADAVAREKSIDRGIVIAAMEDAIAKAARARYGSETDVHAEIDAKKGELRLSRHMLVVEQVENSSNQISLIDAQRANPGAQVGDTIADTLPPLEYGRIAAQSAKQVIVQKVREAERDRQYQEFKDRIGDIVNGIVKRVEYGSVIVDLGRGEAIVRRDEMLPREVFRNGDRVRAYIFDVRRETRGPQIFLSRTHPQFMAKLFAQEVPEIYDGIVEIKAVARDPGSRAKIGVISRDSSVDPVGACVGMRGSRVQAVVNELQGEKIDIIPWSPDIATFVVNALAPAEVAKVVIDEERERIEVVVPDTNNQLSLAIGRRGQNVRLASQLTGWDIDILTEQEKSERRQADFENSTRVFMESLNVDEVVGQLLASEGFTSVEELALVDVKELAGRMGHEIEGVHTPPPIEGDLVVGEVLAIEELTEFKKPIRFVTLDVGSGHGAGNGRPAIGALVICGASNFAVGDKVAVALPGTVLPGGFAIASRQTYGRLSDGMICSAAELHVGQDHSGILVLGPDAEVGTDARPLVGATDTVFELEITPDRGFALSIRGLARELSAAFDVPFTDPAAAPIRDVAGEPEPWPVTIADPSGCDRFVVVRVTGVDPSAPSPWLIRRRLLASGIRSISLAVDVTNYVMVEFGQPLHAFDAASPGRHRGAPRLRGRDS